MNAELEAINEMLRRAVERGEVAADEPAIGFCPHQFVSVVLARPVLEGEHAGVDYLVRFVDAVVVPALGVPAERTHPDRREISP
jgi:hypothetical protein